MEISCIHGTRGLGVVVLEGLLIQKMGCVCHVYSAAKCASYESHGVFPLGSTGKWYVAVGLELGRGLERGMGLFMNTWPCSKEVK